MKGIAGDEGSGWRGSDRPDLSRCLAALNRLETCRSTGTVTQLIGLLIESEGPAAAVGDFCEVRRASGRPVRSQVIGFRNGRLLSMPLEETSGVRIGDLVVARRDDARVPVGPGLLGRVIDGFGQPIDGGPAIEAEDQYELYKPAPGPLEREPVLEPLVTGIRAIDSLVPCGKGQRIGIFGASGVGKSVLLGALARHNLADVTVVALVGERNREVREFIEQELGPEAMKRAIVVAAASDHPAPLRVRAAFVAMAVAEYFRDSGADVLLAMDSATRLAMAQREIGLAAGEPPGRRGYPPSVFSLLPRICERAGRFRRGSITGFWTVLVEGDDFDEPVADALRAILDGHITLSRRLAAAGHYPAIDVLNSVSRLSPRLTDVRHRDAGRRVREALAAYQQAEDLINLGAYVSGSNPKLDSAIRALPEILEFLRQDVHRKSPLRETQARLESLAKQL